MEKEACRIKVGVRVRPLMSTERESGAQNVIVIDNNDPNRGKVISKKNGDSYFYDWAFELSAEQRTVYNSMCKSLIEDLFKGFNATFLAYGQTGSGKTFTMGTADMQNGVIPYAMRDIFEKRNEITKRGAKVDINISFIEIYMEECYDLLCKKQQQDAFDKSRLDLRETSSGETSLDGLSTWPVYDMESVAMYLSEAAKVRSTGTTAMNSQSSRSHAICTISVRVNLPAEENQGTTGTPMVLLSKLHLVDLAGSERAKKTLATGDAFQEGISINKGLLALGNVVAALANKPTTSGHVHVPYRESKLTRLLKDSLGGNGMTVLLACISPAESNYEETINTLRFASRASSVVNKAKVNLDVASLGSEANAALVKELSGLKLQVEDLQNKLRERDTTFQGRDSATVIKSLICRLVSRMRSLLITCLEDDISIEDSEIVALKEDISDLRRYFHLKERPPDNRAAFEDAESDDIDVLPAIMSAIEDIKAIRNELSAETGMAQVCNQSQSDSSELEEQDELTCDELLRQQVNSLDIDDELLLRLGDDSEDENDEDDGCDEDSKPDSEVYHDLCKKEAEMTEINIKSTEFAASIDQLNNDIAALRSEQQRLLSKQKENVGVSSQPSSSHALASTSLLTKKPLYQQSMSTHTIKASAFAGSSQLQHKESIEDLRIKRELKEKSRLLEEKMKALKSKESELSKITTQKDKLANEVSNMRTVVDEQKKQRTNLQKKMREDNATFQNEKVKLKFSEIQSKRRELLAQQSLNKLGNQLQNKEKVWKGQLDAMERQSKLLKEQLLKKEQAQRSREVGEEKASTRLTAAKLGDLKQMLSKRCEQQVKISLIQNQLSQAVSKRNLINKQITTLQADQLDENGDNDGANTDLNLANSEVQQLVKQLKDANRENAGPFSKEIANVTEARVVAELLLSMATKAQLQERRLQDQVEKMQEQLLAHHAQLQKIRSAGNKKRSGGRGRRRRDEEGVLQDESDDSDVDMLDETFYPSDEERRRMGKPSTRPSKRKERSTSSNESSDKGIGESAESGDGNVPDENDRSGDKGAKKQRQKKMKRPAVEIISSTAGVAKKVKAQLQVRSPVEAHGSEEVVVLESNREEAAKPLSQCTVKELKAMLKERGLSVSGVKEELIERLETGVPSTGRSALSNLSVKEGDRAKRPAKKERKLHNLSGEGQKENIPEGSNISMPNEVGGGHDGKPDCEMQVKKRKLYSEENTSYNSIYHSESFMH